MLQGRIQEFVQLGHNLFFFPRGAQHPLGPENPLNTINYTDPGSGFNPHSTLPLNTPLMSIFIFTWVYSITNHILARIHEVIHLFRVSQNLLFNRIQHILDFFLNPHIFHGSVLGKFKVEFFPEECWMSGWRCQIFINLFYSSFSWCPSFISTNHLL